MKSFPMFIRTTGRRVVIAGGGEQAAQKARLMLKTDARIVLAAADLEPELAEIVARGRATHHAGDVTAATFEGAAMGLIATGCAGADAALAALAGAARCPVNVVDRPDLCDLTTPSIVDRDPVVVAIGTEGTAPVLARRLKTRLERLLDPRLGGFAALAGRLRPAVAARVPREARRGFWAEAFGGAPWAAWKRGAEAEAARLLKGAIAGDAPPPEGRIALVGAGPGARDLLTLRAVERLQEADVIFYDRLVDEDVLELARRDAERVCVGKAVGACAWPQERISALIAAEAAKGRRVVRLKSGDPSIYGRACDELAAARAAGVPVEVVPGITAASAAAAGSRRPLTERGVTDSVVLTTGACRPGDAPPDWSALARPGTTLCVYMGVAAAAGISEGLARAGMAPGDPVEIHARISRADGRVLDATVATLPAALREAGIRGEALILARRPKRAAVERVPAAGADGAARAAVA
jgi:uroporphyrin-III C-methyltransferase/precorrin-2 dehydrogenase/sirohydrochlorin ferrochelatase